MTPPPFDRVIWIVLDSVGIGAMPDAADYGAAAGYQPGTQLTAAQVEKWETEWERMATTFELETSRGLTYTEEEKAAGEGTRQLTQKSPPPQTGIKIESIQ